MMIYRNKQSKSHVSSNINNQRAMFPPTHTTNKEASEIYFRGQIRSYSGLLRDELHWKKNFGLILIGAVVVIIIRMVVGFTITRAINAYHH
jgi:hypothetical protein